MRTINIDLNNLNNPYNIGFLGEGNFREIHIKLSEELSQADYYVCAFEDVNGNRHPSARLQAIENVVSITLWQELLQSNRLILNIEAYKENQYDTIVWKGKSQTINLLVHNATDSDGGVSDEQLNSLIAEIAQLENRLKEIKEEVENGDYKGDPGEDGKDGESGIYVGNNPPPEADFWIDPNSRAPSVATENYVDDRVSKIKTISNVTVNGSAVSIDNSSLSFANSANSSTDYVRLQPNYDNTKIELDNKIGTANDLEAVFLGETNLNSRNSLTTYLKRMCEIITLKTALKSDLTKYVTSTNLKNNYYDKTQINSLISNINTLSMLVVDTLPTQNISTTTIYLVAIQNRELNNFYNEYVYINSKWELIGNTAVDLSNYVNIDDFNLTVERLETELSHRATKDELTSAVNTINSLIGVKADKTYVDTNYYNKTSIEDLLVSKMDSDKIWTGTQAEHDKLVKPDGDTTLYFIVEG